MNIQALVLAAGKGKRINATQTPKVLYPLLGKPMILYCLETLRKAGFKKPVVVIGFGGEEIKKLLKNEAVFVWQRKQLGTGHAVLKARAALEGAKSVLIILGDMPFWKPETFKALVSSHQKTKAALSLVSVVLDDPSFWGYGRILRDKKDQVLGIMEEKVATQKQKKIKECNPSCYLVETNWLFENLPKIQKSGAGEYYLTDILALAVKQKEKINVLKIEDFKQVVGINTPEQLKLAEKTLEERGEI